MLIPENGRLSGVSGGNPEMSATVLPAHAGTPSAARAEKGIQNEHFWLMPDRFAEKIAVEDFLFHFRRMAWTSAVTEVLLIVTHSNYGH